MKPATILLAPLAFAVGTQAITLTECRIACEGGQEAMERFCRIIPHAALREHAGVLPSLLTPRVAKLHAPTGATGSGETASGMSSRCWRVEQEISLATDFALTGLVLPGEPKA